MTDDELMMIRFRHAQLVRFRETHKVDEAMFSGTSYQDRLREQALISALDIPMLLHEIERLRELLTSQNTAVLPPAAPGQTPP